MGVSGADLLADTGELTQVGSVFVEKYQDLQRCEDFSSSIASSQPAGTLMASTGGAASADVVRELVGCMFFVRWGWSSVGTPAPFVLTAMMVAQGTDDVVVFQKRQG